MSCLDHTDVVTTIADTEGDFASEFLNAFSDDGLLGG